MEQVLPPNGSNPAIITTSSAAKSRSQSRSPVKKEEDEEQKGENANDEEKVGGDITVRLEPGQPPKLARSTSQKVVPRPPPLFLDLPDSTEEARSSFEVMETCTYANKSMGYTEHAMECDCAEEWGKLFFFLSLPPFFLFFLDLRLLFYSIYFILLAPILGFLKNSISSLFFFLLPHSCCQVLSLFSSSNHDLQILRLAKIWHVVRIRIVSTAQPKSSVWAIVAVVRNARIRDFSERSTPMYPSSKPKRRGTAYVPSPTCDRNSSFSSTSVR